MRSSSGQDRARGAEAVSLQRVASPIVKALWIAALVTLLAPAPRAAHADAAASSDDERPLPYTPAATHAGYRIESRLIPMRDGVRLALDVTLPAKLAPGERIPAILHQTRYWRRVRLRWPAPLFVDVLGTQGRLGAIKRRFLAQGYAWIDVDTRGSGASFGMRAWDYAPDEIQDGAEVVDWIVAQPWSNGRVGAAGASYTGNAAELLLVNGHPAVKAVAASLCGWDEYADLLAPGGVPLAFYYEAWGSLTKSLDRNEPPGAGWRSRLFVEGVAPVDGKQGEALRSAAVAEHAANYDFRVLSRIVFRDDLPFFEPDASSPVQRAALARSFAWLADRFGPGFRSRGVDLASTHAYAAAVRAAGVPVYAYSGWLDVDYARAAIERFTALGVPGSKLLIGPFDHASYDVSPGGAGGPSRFDHAGELLKFFDRYLKGIATGVEQEPAVHYFTLGAQHWRAAGSWPPPTQSVTRYLAAGSLSDAEPTERDAADVRDVDFTAGAGRQTRWDGLLGSALPPLGRDTGARRPGLFAYASDPLTTRLDVTGSPRVFLWLAASAQDAAVFARLDDLAPDGSVIAVTDGQLRAVHRRLAFPAKPAVALARSFLRRDAEPLQPGEPAELVFDLEPTSYRFEAGHRIRLSVDGSEVDHFLRVPAAGDVRLTLHRDHEHPSRIELPVELR